MGPVQQAPSAILAASAISHPSPAEALVKPPGSKRRAPEVAATQTDNEHYHCHRRTSGNGLSDHNINNSTAKTPLPVAKAPKYGATEQQQQRFVCSLDSRHPHKGGGPGDGNESGLSPDEAAAAAVKQRDWLERAADRIPGLGVMLSLCASVFLGSAGMLVKVTQSVHGIQVAVLRAVIQLLVYGLVIHWRRSAWFPRRGERLAVMGRASLGAASITCSYFALKLIPLGDATVIRFSLPIWTLIVSYLVLNESCSLLKVAAVVVSISGVVLIAKPDMCVYLLHLLGHSLGLESDQELAERASQYESVLIKSLPDSGGSPEPDSSGISQQLKGSLLALSSSVCLAMSLIALRLCHKTPTEITIVWLSIFSIIMGTATLLCIGEWRLPNNWPDVVYILLNGACGAIGQWFITNALKIEQSGVISLARTADIEVAFLYSAFLLREQIRLTSLIGSLLVSFGVVAVVVPKWLSSKSTPPSDTDADSNSATNKEPAAHEKSVAVASVGSGRAPRQTRSVC